MPAVLRLLLLVLGVLYVNSCSSPEHEDAPPFERYVDELRQDAQRHGATYNHTLACYVDLTRPDNSDRFFVLDLIRGKIVLKAPCLNGLTSAQGQVRYSNAFNSNCSSRGLARIGEQYVGNFGRAFRLCGLEPSTSNLRARTVVLHAWAGVPARPTAGHPVQSEGCPTVNPVVLDTVAAIIARSPKPLLLRLH